MKKVFLKTIAVLFVLFVVNLSYSQPKAEHNGVVAPNFVLNDINGNKVQLSDLKGKVIILDFWATWCPPCRQEIPHFNDLQKQFKDQGLVVLGVSLDTEGIEVVKTFVDQSSNMDYTVLWLDPTNSMQSQITQVYQNLLEPSERSGIPFTFIIDREGYIQKKYVGYRDKDVFLNAITPLLTEGKSIVKK